MLLSILVEFWLTDVAEPLPALDSSSTAGGTDKSPSSGPGGAQGGGRGPTGQATAGMGGPMSPLLPAAAGGGLMGSPLGVGGGAAAAGGAGGKGAAAAVSPPVLRVLSFQPPSEELVEALSQLVRYITVLEPGAASSKGMQETIYP